MGGGLVSTEQVEVANVAGAPYHLKKGEIFHAAFRRLIMRPPIRTKKFSFRLFTRLGPGSWTPQHVNFVRLSRTSPKAIGRVIHYTTHPSFLATP